MANNQPHSVRQKDVVPNPILPDDRPAEITKAPEYSVDKDPKNPKENGNCAIKGHKG